MPIELHQNQPKPSRVGNYISNDSVMKCFVKKRTTIKKLSERHVMLRDVRVTFVFFPVILAVSPGP